MNWLRLKRDDTPVIPRRIGSDSREVANIGTHIQKDVTRCNQSIDQKLGFRLISAKKKVPLIRLEGKLERSNRRYALFTRKE